MVGLSLVIRRGEESGGVNGKPQMASLPLPGRLSPRKSPLMDLGVLLCFRGPLNRIRTLRVEIGERGEEKVLVNPFSPLITESDLSE